MSAESEHDTRGFDAETVSHGPRLGPRFKSWLGSALHTVAGVEEGEYE